jgi:hypothetical protein
MPQLKRYTDGYVRAFDRVLVEETRTIDFIISSAARDRHRSIVNMDGWSIDNFNRNPIVGYQHNVYGDNLCVPDDPDNVIGEGRAWTEGEGANKLLIGSVRFEPADINPRAEKIFRKVLNGSLRATSVGFLETGKGEYKNILDSEGNIVDRTYYFKGQELLEFSIVNIPSNPEAVGRSLSVQADFALAYIHRFLPDTLSLADIRKLTVGEILDAVKDGVYQDVDEQTKEKKVRTQALRVRQLQRIERDLELYKNLTE